MTSALDRLAQSDPSARQGHTSQATAVEQSRAVAEVQAAVTVAQMMPRSLTRAIAEMKDSCGRTALAQRAFYAVPNRGTGPSVHLARELARVWGNVQYGVHELRRDDEAGESEILAMAWDVQTNVRSTRTFIVPHQRMKKVAGKQTRENLVDLGDIYNNNQNVGARAVRECIFTVLPTWFTEEAQDLCRVTLRDGDGKPLAERVANMVAVFGVAGIRQAQLEARSGKRRGQWDAGDLAQLAIDYTSVTRDGVPADELFPTERVTADEIGSRFAERAPEPPVEQTPPDEPPADDAPQTEEPPPERDWDVPVAQAGGGGRKTAGAR